ncbi:MAG TPA: sulfurtransferase [Saprospirales bacterium]|nr:sulfurtransferase [Saprospirales bacterium]HRQ28612.1 YeeE/YedE thiosulfate transporter family protein [Saprospiraceae bacterium]
MGPLVPDIIGSEFNFVIALLIGIAFGFVLEQAGFSTTKKLVGLFYGYDFTVLKVFFTAGITAMVGVVLLAHLGLLDLDLIYINPTYVRAALIGGGIMGAGFIIGGFCPGTSICALATGKIGAFWFIVGSLFGMLIFMEAYPVFEKIYMADNWGPVRIDKYLGLSQEVFAIIMTATAIAAFFFTQKIQDRLLNIKPSYSRNKIWTYSSFAAMPFIIIALVAITPNSRERMLAKAGNIGLQEKAKEIMADKLILELANNYYNINLIDLRDSSSFQKSHLPLAINIPYDSLLNRSYEDYFKQHYKTNVFYADHPQTAKKAYVIATNLGNAETLVLHESAEQFDSLIFKAEIPATGASKSAQQLYQFRKTMAQNVKQIEDRMQKQSQPVKKETKKVKGGCS